jgi:hypothetical protein
MGFIVHFGGKGDVLSGRPLKAAFMAGEEARRKQGAREIDTSLQESDTGFEDAKYTLRPISIFH